MRLAVTSARVALGAVCVVLGLNGLLHVVPPPTPPADGGAFLDALEAGGVMALAKGAEVGAGALLLAGRAVPLALALLTPVVVGIGLYHATYDPAGGAAGGGVAVLLAFLVWAYRAQFLPLLAPASAATATARSDAGSARRAGVTEERSRRA